MVRPLFLSLLVLVIVAFPLVRAEPPGADEMRVNDFIKALKSDNAGVRKQVALALGDLGEKAKSAVPALRELLLDSEKDVQAAAARALGQINGEKALVDEKKTSELQQKLVNAQVEADLLKKRLAALEDRLRELEKAPKQDKTPEAKNPPSEPVEGLVKTVDENSGVVLVTIGSDVGLQKGHTLEVFRLNPPKYVGTVRILDVKPTEAACKPINKLLTPIVVGDRVASKLVGN
jgi:hypothetical protein